VAAAGSFSAHMIAVRRALDSSRSRSNPTRNRSPFAISAKRAASSAGSRIHAAFRPANRPVQIGDPASRQSRLQRLPVELGIKPAVGRRPDITDKLDAVPSNQLDESLERMIGVADGEEFVRHVESLNARARRLTLVSLPRPIRSGWLGAAADIKERSRPPCPRRGALTA